MYYSSDDIKKIEDFQKYARFICDHFDIEVELDSTKAETNGRVISLPNVSGLSEQELDMMYTILLHEAGHIKFSIFTEEAFIQLKTKAHAYLANAIEDARIENLLMKEFAGAPEMFSKLYSEYAVNRKLMKKVFNISTKRPDLFNCLGVYIHAYLIDCKTAPFSRVATRVNYAKIKTFVKKNKIHQLLDNSLLKNWDDVISLTNTIYDLFIKEFSDTSDKCSFAEDLALKQKTEKTLIAIQAEIAKTTERMQEVQKKIEFHAEEYKKWQNDHSEELDDLEHKTRVNNEKNSDISQALKNRKEHKNLEQKVIAQNSAINSVREKIAKNNADLDALKEKIKNGLNGRGKPFTEKQSESNNEQLKNKQTQLESLEKKLNDAKSKLEQAEKELKNFKSTEKSEFKNLTNEQLKEKSESLTKENAELNESINKLTQERTNLESKIDSLQQEINSTVSELQLKIMNQMYELDQQGLSQDVSLDILPDFEETPGWHEADLAQQEFDRQASKERKEVVRNGGRMAGLIGSNLRDLSIYIDNKLEKVQEINLLDLFEKKAGVSRFPQLNEGNNGIITNTITDKSIRSQWGSVDKHTVLTTQFDIVKNENMTKSPKEVKTLLDENVEFIRVLKRSFMNKFKYSKKDFYRGGKEDGQLDNRNLWKLPTNQGDDYYEINARKFINKMAASILIDVSGSQDKLETDYGKKLKVMTLALSEALKTVHVHHEILGYHAPISDEMREVSASVNYNRRSNKLETLIYKNFTQNDNSAIANIEIQSSDNSDGESIRIALQRLKRERAKSKVLFVITDGKPFLSDGDVTILDEDLKTALREAVKNKIQVFAFGFAPNGKDFYGDRFCHIQDYTDVLKFVEKMAL